MKHNMRFKGYIICDYCGELFVEGEPFCPYCGKPAEEIIKNYKNDKQPDEVKNKYI